MPVGVAMLVTAWLQYRMLRRFERSGAARVRPYYRQLAWLLFAACCVLQLAGLAATSNRLAGYYPARIATWVHAASLVCTIFTFSAYLVMTLMAVAPADPGRRRFLKGSLSIAAAAPVAVAGYGVFIERSAVRLEEIDIPIPGLPKELEGARIGQITDIHLGPFLSRKDLDRAVSMLNEAKPNVAVVTGDLISRRGDPLDECLGSLAELKSDAGTFACMGNHERYARAEEYATLAGARLGIRFLRRTAAPLRFGGAVLNLAGTDYEMMRRVKSAYLRNARRMLVPDAVNVLLQHNPDVFPRAAEEGFDLTLAGHTHGGQVNIEILHEDWNVARFYTDYTAGLYRRGKSAIYVNRGLGTIGVPVRVGAPPEVAVIRLCAG